MQIKVGQALKSAVDDTAVIITKAPGEDASLTCGGVEMYVKGGEAPAGAEADPGQMKGSVIGKRYTDAAGRIELLCTMGGDGSLALDGELLEQQQAKSLPASD